jgi:hypothetical protein
MEGDKMKRNKRIEEQKVGDKTVLFDTDSFKFYELNETMGFIWDLLKNETTKKQITEKLTKEFDVDAKRAERDMDKAVESLKGKNLVF